MNIANIFWATTLSPLFTLFSENPESHTRSWVIAPKYSSPGNWKVCLDSVKIEIWRKHHPCLKHDGTLKHGGAFLLGWLSRQGMNTGYWSEYCSTSAGNMTAQTDEYRLAWPKCRKSSNGFLQLLVRIHRGRVSWISLVNFTIKRDTTKSQCWDLARTKITLTMLIIRDYGNYYFTLKAVN